MSKLIYPGDMDPEYVEPEHTLKPSIRERFAPVTPQATTVVKVGMGLGSFWEGCQSLSSLFVFAAGAGSSFLLAHWKKARTQHNEAENQMASAMQYSDRVNLVEIKTQSLRDNLIR